MRISVHSTRWLFDSLKECVDMVKDEKRLLNKILRGCCVPANAISIGKYLYRVDVTLTLVKSD